MSGLIQLLVKRHTGIPGFQDHVHVLDDLLDELLVVMHLRQRPLEVWPEKLDHLLLIALRVSELGDYRVHLRSQLAFEFRCRYSAQLHSSFELLSVDRARPDLADSLAKRWRRRGVIAYDDARDQQIVVDPLVVEPV